MHIILRVTRELPPSIRKVDSVLISTSCVLVMVGYVFGIRKDVLESHGHRGSIAVGANHVVVVVGVWVCTRPGFEFPCVAFVEASGM